MCIHSHVCKGICAHYTNAHAHDTHDTHDTHIDAHTLNTQALDPACNYVTGHSFNVDGGIAIGQ